MRIAVVTATPSTIDALRRALATAGHTVAWAARSDLEAIDRARADTPDALVLELSRARGGPIDAVACARALLERAQCPLLLVAEAVGELYEPVYELMEAGAVAAVELPRIGAEDRLEGEGPLLEKLRTVERLSAAPSTARGGGAAATRGLDGARAAMAERPVLVAIGASAGGPPAVAELLANVPRPFRGAVVLIQHLDATFAAGLASWLQSQTGFPTRLAEPGAAPEAGVALVAASADHLVLEPNLRLAYTAIPRELPYRPSVDVFFRSAAERWPLASVGVLLTGMGRDGAAGLLALREAGWDTIAQDEASSAIYGMPRAARELGAAQRCLPLSAMGAAIAAAVASAEARRAAALPPGALGSSPGRHGQ